MILLYFSYGTMFNVNCCNADALLFELHMMERYFVHLYNAMQVFDTVSLVVC